MSADAAMAMALHDGATRVSPTEDVANTPPPPAARIKTRAFARLEAFDIKASTKLSGMLEWLKGLKSVEKSAAEKAAEAVPADTIALTITTAFSKVLRFESTAGSADDVDWLADLRNHGKVSRFLQMLRDRGFSQSSLINYLHACSTALNYLAQQDLSADARATLQQTVEHYKCMKKPRSKARRKEVRKRNSRAAMENDGTWLDLAKLGSIVAAAEKEADELAAQCSQSREDVDTDVDVSDAIRYRGIVVFLLFAKAKLCRPMIYASLDVGTWTKRQRDGQGRCWFASDSFKTSGCAQFGGLDAVVVPLDVEVRVETYLRTFRPVLVAARPQDGTDSTDTDDSDDSPGAGAEGAAGAVPTAAAAAAVSAAAPAAAAAAGAGSGALEWLFVGRCGRRYTRLSDDVKRLIRRHAGAHLTISITSLRKALQTAAADELSTEDARLIALNDKHSDATAREHYEKKHALGEASRALVLQNRLTRVALPAPAVATAVPAAVPATATPAAAPAPGPAAAIAAAAAVAASSSVALAAAGCPPLTAAPVGFPQTATSTSTSMPATASPMDTADAAAAAPGFADGVAVVTSVSAAPPAPSHTDMAPANGAAMHIPFGLRDAGVVRAETADRAPAANTSAGNDGGAHSDATSDEPNPVADAADEPAEPAAKKQRVASPTAAPIPAVAAPPTVPATQAAPSTTSAAAAPSSSTALPASPLLPPPRTLAASAVDGDAGALIGPPLPTAAGHSVDAHATAVPAAASKPRSRPPAAAAAAAAAAVAAVAMSAGVPSGTFTAEMDAVLMRIGSASRRAPWASTKHSHPSLFAHVTSEQMRWRFRNLTKPNPAKTSCPPRQLSSKRKASRPPSSSSSRAAAAGGSAPTPQTPSASANTNSPGIALRSISASKTISGVLFLRAACVGAATEQWLPEAAIRHDPVFQRWLSSA